MKHGGNYRKMAFFALYSPANERHNFCESEFAAYRFLRFYIESRERRIQTIMKVSSKSLNYLPIFFSNSMMDMKVDSLPLQ